MAKTLFIADLHLSNQCLDIVEKCHTFLIKCLKDYQGKELDTLYILGDLFESWLGDDDDDPTYHSIIQTLKKLTDTGLPIYIMHGNRDFLLGERFAKMTGCQLIPDELKVDLYGTPTLLMHGDTLCTLDVSYQRFREQVRNPLWQQQFLAYPLEQRRALAQQARLQSQAYTQNVEQSITDVTPQAVENALMTHHVNQLIHGHTHLPAIHEFEVNHQPTRRIVLGDWQTGKCCVLSYTDKGYTLQDCD